MPQSSFVSSLPPCRWSCSLANTSGRKSRTRRRSSGAPKRPAKTWLPCVSRSASPAFLPGRKSRSQRPARTGPRCTSLCTSRTPADSPGMSFFQGGTRLPSRTGTPSSSTRRQDERCHCYPYIRLLLDRWLQSRIHHTSISKWYSDRRCSAPAYKHHVGQSAQSIFCP